MNKQALQADILLLITACVWGFAFVAQRSAMEDMGPFTFNGIRFVLGSLSLVPFVICRMRNPERRKDGITGRPLTAKVFMLSAFLAGSCLFCAATLQQIGIMYTTAGHSGFITGLYVVLTPIFGIFLGKKTGLPTWIGAAFTLAGLFFISIASQLFGRDALESPRLNPGDLLTAVSALFWTCHVLLIDSLAKRVDPVALASGQFIVCGLLSAGAALFREAVSLDALLKCAVPILYSGFGSVGLAYTLQVVGQKYAPPAHATILLSLEGVFAAIGGVILLSEPLGHWTLLGFALIFCGMLATQLDVLARRRNG
ncbi:MAG: DMT family transporter [Spirochaetaceae bacterium]|jgi:drug/metabolite transporter (DMT)-like permease|nr:DMT family transporter [Spirochaetaceae bacterium]